MLFEEICDTIETAKRLWQSELDNMKKNTDRTFTEEDIKKIVSIFDMFYKDERRNKFDYLSEKKFDTIKVLLDEADNLKEQILELMKSRCK